MRTVRECCFETNSSSTHTIVMCNDRDLARFKAGKLFAHKYDDYGVRLNNAVLVNLDYAVRMYERLREDCDYGELPVLTKAQLGELMCDPVSRNDYSYLDDDNDRDSIKWNFEKHNYSEGLKKAIESAHSVGIYDALRADDFPKSYELLLRVTDKKDRSEKKLNVLDFTIWD